MDYRLLFSDQTVRIIKIIYLDFFTQTTLKTTMKSSIEAISVNFTGACDVGQQNYDMKQLATGHISATNTTIDLLNILSGNLNHNFRHINTRINDIFICICPNNSNVSADC
jgi:hypothetical protein